MASANGGNPEGPPCRHWAAGKCNFPNCGFSHEGPGGTSPLGPYTAGASVPPRTQPQQAIPHVVAPRKKLPPPEEELATSDFNDFNDAADNDLFQQLLGTSDPALSSTSTSAPGSNGGNPNGPPCKHWAAGKCNFANCNFSHEGPGAVSPLGPYPGAQTGQQPQQQPPQAAGGVDATQLLLGSAQPISSILQQLLGGGASARPADGPPRGGNPNGPPCNHWAAGKCNMPNCKFSHEGPGSASPLGPYGQPPQQQQRPVVQVAAAVQVSAQNTLIEQLLLQVQAQQMQLQQLQRAAQQQQQAPTHPQAVPESNAPRGLFNISMSPNGGNPSGLPCKHWAAGKCNFADCKYSHEGPGGVSLLGPYTPRTDPHRQPEEGEAPITDRGGNPNGPPCKHWAVGKCNMPTCNFSHEGPGFANPRGIYPGAGGGSDRSSPY